MDNLIQIGCNAAMKAAVHYIDQHNLTYDMDALVACVRANVKAQLPQALADAKLAIDAHMDCIDLYSLVQIGQTFAATMALAGIDAAKEACSHR